MMTPHMLWRSETERHGAKSQHQCGAVRINFCFNKGDMNRINDILLVYNQLARQTPYQYQTGNIQKTLFVYNRGPRLLPPLGQQVQCTSSKNKPTLVLTERMLDRYRKRLTSLVLGHFEANLALAARL